MLPSGEVAEHVENSDVRNMPCGKRAVTFI
jgi:hypothetical protein